MEANHPRADGFVLTRDLTLWFVDHYLAHEEDARDPRASPLLAEDLSGLPPAFVITAGFDPLCETGQAYVERLQAAAVPVEHRFYEGQIHGFVSMSAAVNEGREALELAARALAEAFAE